MIDIDKNRKTFRSNVKKRSGGRLPGLEMHYQGLDLVEGDIARGPLPILARGGYGIQHEYSLASDVYESRNNTDVIGLEKIIDIFIKLDPTTNSYSGGTEVDFTGLVGETFTVNNPEYKKTGTGPQLFTFEFTSDVGVDPRLPYQAGGLHSDDIGQRGDSFNINMKDHLLRPYPRYPEHSKFETTHNTALQLYGQYVSGGPSTPVYKIPLGLPTTAFPEEQRPNNDSSSPDINTDNFDLTTAAVFQRLAVNPYWLYAVITRSLHNALPSYIKVVDPDRTPAFPNISKERGAVCLWDKYDLSSSASGMANLRIKLRYNPIVPDSNFTVVNQGSSSTDVVVDSWDFTKNHQYVRVGKKTIKENPFAFHENRRTDFLKQSIVRPIDGSVADIRFLGPNVSSGTTIPSIPAGQDIVKYEEQLSVVAATPSSPQVISEDIGILKQQSRDFLKNSYSRDFVYYEDVHYVDPNQQRHSNLQEQWPQFLDVNDFGGSESAAFVQHLTNVFDYRYTPMRLHPEAPMSGRIDVLDRIRSFYENMPEAVLTNTKKTVSAQSFELDAVTIVKTKYLKKSEEIDVKKFEDVRGERNEGHQKHHLFQNETLSGLVPGRVYPSFIFDEAADSYRLQKHFTDYYFHGAIQTSYDISKNTPDATYLGMVDEQNPVAIVNDDMHDPDTVDQIMFVDYFDQREPDVLDFVEEDPWSSIDPEMMIWLTKRYYDDDNNPTTPEAATGRSIELDHREYHQDAYLYANTGHTTVHYEQVNGIIAPLWKR